MAFVCTHPCRRFHQEEEPRCARLADTSPSSLTSASVATVICATLRCGDTRCTVSLHHYSWWLRKEILSRRAQQNRRWEDDTGTTCLVQCTVTASEDARGKTEDRANMAVACKHSRSVSMFNRRRQLLNLICRSTGGRQREAVVEVGRSKTALRGTGGHAFKFAEPTMKLDVGGLSQVKSDLDNAWLAHAGPRNVPTRSAQYRPRLNQPRAHSGVSLHFLVP